MALSGLLHALARFVLVSNAYPPIPVAARFKVWVCGRSFAGIACSNPTGAWMSVSCECSVLCAGVYVGLITRSEEPYRVQCV